MRTTSSNTAGRQLRVLTLTPFYPSKDDEASGCFIAEPLPWQERHGVSHAVFAVQPAYRGRMCAHADSPPATCLSYFALPGGFGLPSAGAGLFARILGRVRRMQERQQIDLIHAHAPLPCGHAAALLSRELGIPFVVSVHGLDAYSTIQVKGMAADWCSRMSRMVYRTAQQVICVSERVREEVIAGMTQGCRATVVYNGVDPAVFAPAADRRKPGPTILSVGNLIPIKGHDLLLRAVAGLKGEFADLSLQFIGDGPERPRLARLSDELGIGDRVRFQGRQDRRAVAQALQRCTVFALPSRYEGLGCAYLEAMAAEKAALGCRGQGIAEIIRHGENGWLVGPDNLDELTSGLGNLLREQTLRQRIGFAARRTVLRNFTLAAQAERLSTIYRDCVA